MNEYRTKNISIDLDPVGSKIPCVQNKMTLPVSEITLVRSKLIVVRNTLNVISSLVNMIGVNENKGFLLLSVTFSKLGIQQ